MIVVAWDLFNGETQTRERGVYALDSMPSSVSVHPQVGFVSSEGLWIIYCGY